jgi:hypothetical protein
MQPLVRTLTLVAMVPFIVFLPTSNFQHSLVLLNVPNFLTKHSKNNQTGGYTLSGGLQAIVEIALLHLSCI